MNTESVAEPRTFPLDDLTFDLVCLMYEKSKGLEALDRYIEDARGKPDVMKLLLRIREQEGLWIQELQRHFIDRSMDGKQIPGHLVDAYSR